MHNPLSHLLPFLLFNTYLTSAQQVFCNPSNYLPVDYSDAEKTANNLCTGYTSHIVTNTVEEDSTGSSYASIFYNNLGCGPGGSYLVPNVGTCVGFMMHILGSCGAGTGGATYDVCGGYRVEHVK